MKRKNLSITKRDYHSLHWLLYVYLQQGRYRKAEELLTLMKQSMSESTYEDKLRPGYYETQYASMAAAFVVETERWDLAEKFFPPSTIEGPVADSPATNAHGGHGTMQSSVSSSIAASGNGQMTVLCLKPEQTLPLFIRGLSSALSGSVQAEKNLIAAGDGWWTGTPMLRIREMEITALMAGRRKDYDQAILSMRQATGLEELIDPPSGPPALIKHSHELYGELLLQAGKAREAAEQFKIALLRQPNRARSLLGLARADVKSGDQPGAIAAYAKLLNSGNRPIRICLSYVRSRLFERLRPRFVGVAPLREKQSKITNRSQPIFHISFDIFYFSSEEAVSCPASHCKRHKYGGL